jgi:hypothetical protein
MYFKFTESIGIKSIEEAGSPDVRKQFLERYTIHRRTLQGWIAMDWRLEIGNDFDLCYNLLKLPHHKLKKEL